MNTESQGEYTVKEAAALLGVSWVLHKKNGRGNTVRKRGKDYEYSSGPVIVEGLHWEWRKGKVIIFQNGYDILSTLRLASQAA
jgi:hypothetical protein